MIKGETVDYTIMEYNFQTKKYTKIGYVTAEDSSKAKEKFAKKNGWKPKKGICLFAKGPLCR